MERRLDRLRAAYRRRERPADGAYDVSGLTFGEQLELDDLLTAPARVQRRTGTPSYAMLTAQERERLDTLLSRVTEAG
jgi:hypothetical protein